MRKLFIALAVMVPAISQAALVIDNGASNQSAAPLTAPAYPSAQAALQAAKNAPAPSAAAIEVLPQSDEGQGSMGLVIAPIWQINSADTTFQQLFSRWGKQAGWSTIWDVDQDIPLVGAGQFGGSFTDAVLEVLHTTESTDAPAHPCFYSNNLMRVVPIATVCDPDKDQ
jgi:hypothetical protein